MNSNASYLFWSTQKYSKVYLLFAVDAYFPTACLDSPSFPVWFIVLILPLHGVTCLIVIVWYPDIVTRDLPAIVPGWEGCILHRQCHHTFPLFLMVPLLQHFPIQFDKSIIDNVLDLKLWWDSVSGPHWPPGRRLCKFSNRISSVNRQVSSSDYCLLRENESQF